MSDATATDAVSGLDRGRERLALFESRAGQLLQATGLTSTLILANSALLVGEGRVSGSAGVIVAGALVWASAGLLAAGLYSLAAIMWTSDRVAPYNTTRQIARASLDDEAAARQRVAALLTAYRRTTLVADWKLARLKRATGAFLLSILGIAVASGALIAQALS